MKRGFENGIVLLLVASTGCITSAGGGLSPIEVVPSGNARELEHTVGDFEFTLEGGKMVTSNRAGRLLNDQILRRWKKKGYVSDYQYVESSKFSGNASFNLTLTGPGEESVRSLKRTSRGLAASWKECHSNSCGT